MVHKFLAKRPRRSVNSLARMCPQVSCTVDELERGTCENTPISGRMWNPCYTAEVSYFSSFWFRRGGGHKSNGLVHRGLVLRVEFSEHRIDLI